MISSCITDISRAVCAARQHRQRSLAGGDLLPCRQQSCLKDATSIRECLRCHDAVDSRFSAPASDGPHTSSTISPQCSSSISMSRRTTPCQESSQTPRFTVVTDDRASEDHDQSSLLAWTICTWVRWTKTGDRVVRWHPWCTRRRCSPHRFQSFCPDTHHPWSKLFTNSEKNADETAASSCDALDLERSLILVILDAEVHKALGLVIVGPKHTQAV